VLLNPSLDIARYANVKLAVTVLENVNAIRHRDQRNWLRGLDLNQRPSGYEPDELPGCSTPRCKYADAGDEIKPEILYEDNDFAAQRMAPAVGFEPTTNRLTADRSTTELRWINQWEERESVFSRTIGSRQLLIRRCSLRVSAFAASVTKF
jgi:hypothetical protein